MFKHMVFQVVTFTASPTQDTKLYSTYSLLCLSSDLLLLNPIISQLGKEKWALIINAFFSVGRRTKELTEKNKSLQPRTTKCKVWVLPRCASRSECRPLPCQELLRGRPFSQMSEICFVSGILSLQEWESPLDLKLKMYIYCSKI